MNDLIKANPMNCSFCQQKLPNRLSMWMVLDKKSAGDYRCPHCSKILASRFQIYRFRLLHIVSIMVIIISTKELLARYLRVNPIENDWQLLRIVGIIVVAMLIILLSLSVTLPVNKKEPSFIKNVLFFMGIPLMVFGILTIATGVLIHAPMLEMVGASMFIGSLFWVYIFY